MATPGGSGGGGEHLHASGSSSSSSSRTTSSSRASSTEPACLTFGVLQEITDNFSEERVLGQGTYGKVYKGILENGEEIAVKMLHNNMQGIDDEKFKHEFDNLMMLDHKNTVRLVAYCYETRRQHTEFKGERVFGETTYKALCFEYMHMGSLQRHLYDESQGLDWQTRYKIIKGTCEGLKYLHEGFKEPIYHLDLKPDNILLDKNMVPKLADFGMSKLFREEQTRVTQSPIGTIGYLPPEYLFGHVVSKKLDIFSLGVIITKIIAGPSGQTRSVEMPSHEFLHQVNDNWRNRLEATCTPQTLEANCIQVSMCTEIGLRCMDMDRKQRPTIMDIIDKLDITETIVQKGGKFNSTISKAHRGVDEDYHPNQQSNPRTRNRRRSSLSEFAARFPSLAETELAPAIVPSASPIRKPVELDLPSHKSTAGKLLNGDLLVNKEGLRIVTQSEKYERPGVGTTDVRSWEPWRREVLPDPQPPVRFGLLSIDDLDAIKVIGKGSSGNVQLVQHKWTGQFFALKVMQLIFQENVRKQMADELKISMSTQCQYVVTCYHCFYVSGIVSIAMEYMDYGSLVDFLKTVRTIPEAYLAAICKQVLKGLVYLHHEKHIIHRDLKPSNILINHRGEIKISDFGVSAIIASSSAQRDTFTGTFSYMAPERISGQKHGCPSDIWSLGLVMLECATGNFPYLLGDSFYDLLEAVVDRPPPSAPSEQHSPEFCSFISACMQKNATDRSSAQILLAHPFLSMYDGLDVDLADYFTSAGSPLITFEKKKSTSPNILRTSLIATRSGVDGLEESTTSFRKQNDHFNRHPKPRPFLAS